MGAESWRVARNKLGEESTKEPSRRRVGRSQSPWSGRGASEGHQCGQSGRGKRGVQVVSGTLRRGQTWAVRGHLREMSLS